MSKSDKNYQPPTHDEIAAYARRIYETEGRPEGRAMEHWLQAEQQLIGERKAKAGHAQAPAPAAKTATKPLQVSSPASANARGEGWQATGRPATHRN